MLRNEEVSAPKSVKEDEILAEWNVEFRKVEKSLNGDFKEHFPKVDGFVRSDPGGFVMMEEYARHAEKVYRFQPRNDDVWVVTFPKCGTTWTQELVWMIMNDCDKVRGKAPIIIRSPFLEFPYMLPPGTMPAEFTKMMVTLEMVEEMPSPRIIKSHLPFYLLHPKLLDTCKVVYVARNPKDVIVSYFHHHQLMEVHGFVGDVETFAQYFMDDERMDCSIHSNVPLFNVWLNFFFSHVFPLFPHILDAWNKRHHPNMLFLFYEDLKKDLRGEIEKVAKFLGKSLSEEQLTDLREHLRFDNFAKNESVNMEAAKQFGGMKMDGHFIRKGKTGDWKNHFGPEINKRIDEWIDKNLKGTDLKFVTELEFQD
ncbi:hypothetical protein GHT06_017641 [Daphnia sinensis]|uniref:Sulfotransferase domain-containing protein n=1 Tax=Daphnia sinensis TaxID=1820382 RepID=A0AAD5KLE1_9CRUS|nr:hypothetical protein GHT06_017641 [Daphnia sinensis]